MLLRPHVDCTNFYFHGGNTGIQRVVRSILANMGKIYPDFQPVVFLGPGNVWELELRFFSRIRLVLFFPLFRLPGFYPVDPFKPAMPWIFAISKLFQCKVRQVLRDGAGSFFSRMLRKIFGSVAGRIEPAKGDLLLLLDLSWNLQLWDEVDRVREAGMRAGFCVFDMVPIFFPSTTSVVDKESYRTWLFRSASNCDFCVTISRAVKAELEEYIRENRAEFCAGRIRVSSFRLGADAAKMEGFVRPEMVQAFDPASDGKPYLILATIEPRKNHGFLLDAFDSLWKKGERVKLCVAGKAGWGCELLLKRIKEHPMLDKLLFLFEDLTEAEVDYGYRNAKALVWPSIYEGFGLPIVEALKRSLPVFASDIPVHREVGGSFAGYFKLDAPGSLVELILQFEKDGVVAGALPISGFDWPDWEQSARELLEAALNPQDPDGTEASIIIPAWNKWEYTRNCLNGLIDTTNLNEAEVIVVDNGSSDETPAGLREFAGKISKLKIIRNPENLGFAKACNQGAASASGKNLVFLNNDTIPRKGWLDEMLKVVNGDPAVGGVGSLLLYPDGTIQHAGVGLRHYQDDRFDGEEVGPLSHLCHLHAKENPDFSGDGRPQLVPALTGACLLIPARHFRDARGFDEKFKNGFEDIDLCFRLRARGLKMVFCPSSVLTHFESITPKRHEHEHENWHYFFSKWPGYLGGKLNGSAGLRPDDYPSDGTIWLDVTGPYLYNPDALPRILDSVRASGETFVPVVWDSTPFPDLEITLKILFLKIAFVLPLAQREEFFRLKMGNGRPLKRVEKEFSLSKFFSVAVRRTRGYEEDLTVKFFRKIIRIFSGGARTPRIGKGERLFIAIS